MSSMPMAPAYVEPIVKTIRVKAGPERAFDVFSKGIDRWWKREFTVNPSRSPQKLVVMEPFAGGRLYEVGEDGSEADWGRVIVWQPPTRLVLRWQLNAEFRFDESFDSEVEVSLLAVDPGVTEIRLEHRKLEAYGAAAGRMATSMSGGWGGLLDAFAGAVD